MTAPEATPGRGAVSHGSLRLAEAEQIAEVPGHWRAYVWQGTVWQRLLRAYGISAWFVNVYGADDRLVAYALVQELSAGGWARYWSGRATRSAAGAARIRTLRVLHGPVVGDPAETEAVHQAFATYLQGRAARWNCAEIVVKPPHYPDSQIGDRLAAIYGASQFRQTRAYTFVVPAQRPLDDLRQRLAAEKRTKLNRAAREGIQVVRATDEHDVERYWKIRSETMRRGRQFEVPLHHYLDTWRALRPSGAMEIFIAEREGEDLAAQILYLSRLDVELVGSATADVNIRRSLPGNDALQWAVIEWAHDNGYRHVDYVGADPDTGDAKRREIHRFKKSWGGELIEYPQFVWRRPIVHWLYRIADRASGHLTRPTR